MLCKITENHYPHLYEVLEDLSVVLRMPSAFDSRVMGFHKI